MEREKTRVRGERKERERKEIASGRSAQRRPSSSLGRAGGATHRTRNSSSTCPPPSTSSRCTGVRRLLQPAAPVPARGPSAAARQLTALCPAASATALSACVVLRRFTPWCRRLCTNRAAAHCSRRRASVAAVASFSGTAARHLAARRLAAVLDQIKLRRVIRRVLNWQNGKFIGSYGYTAKGHHSKL